jgi:hypothetical protein
MTAVGAAVRSGLIGILLMTDHGIQSYIVLGVHLDPRIRSALKDSEK